MKLRPVLIAATLLLNFGAVGTTQAQSGTTPSAAEEAKETKPKPQKKPAPHSHVQEKTGIPQSAPIEASASEKAKLKKLHQHQRDAK